MGIVVLETNLEFNGLSELALLLGGLGRDLVDDFSDGRSTDLAMKGRMDVSILMMDGWISCIDGASVTSWLKIKREGASFRHQRLLYEDVPISNAANKSSANTCKGRAS